MSTQELHKAQVSILRTLRHTTAARYTVLRQPTDLESDVFKFHLRKLVRQQYVRKLDSGEYELTSAGKEFANNLSESEQRTQKQPKLSVAIIASREFDGTKKYLCQQRLRSPFYGFWGCLSGPVQWGESFEIAAQREFEKQTGLTATYVVRAFYRSTDYSEKDILLEDKLFAIVEASDVCGEITNDWQKGFNAWLGLAELKTQEKYFTSTCDFIAMLESGEQFRVRFPHYAQSEY